jgi:hypothetical protein
MLDKTTNGSEGSTVVPLSKKTARSVVISPPNLVTAIFVLQGVAPYVGNRFPEKAKNEIRQSQTAGSRSKKGKQREARDFDAEYEAAKHRSTEGWCGIPASAFRSACISACRMAGFQMTRAKLSIFIEPDGFDAIDGVPLVRIIGEPERHESYTRPRPSVTTLAVRPMWREWAVELHVAFDADQFSETDVANLLNRAGRQVGIGEGRPDSKSSCGMGWGLWRLSEMQVQS